MKFNIFTTEKELADHIVIVWVVKGIAAQLAIGVKFLRMEKGRTIADAALHEDIQTILDAHLRELGVNPSDMNNLASLEESLFVEVERLL